MCSAWLCPLLRVCAAQLLGQLLRLEVIRERLVFVSPKNLTVKVSKFSVVAERGSSCASEDSACLVVGCEKRE